MFEVIEPTVDTLIERLAQEALTALRQDCERAREEISRRFAFINRSRGQLRRYELQRRNA